MDRYGPAADSAAVEAGIGFAADRRADTTFRHPRPIARDAATTAEWGDRPPPRQMVLRRWRPMRRNTLHGFAYLELANGLQIDDVAVHIRDGRAWASLPARPMLDADGRHVVREGKPQYATILRWRTRDLADRWSAAVIELIRQANPGALNREGRQSSRSGEDRQ
jgi:hypothetical protein